MVNKHTISEDETKYKPRDGLHKFSPNNTMPWNWTKCRNCKGTGKTSNWGPMGKEISVDTCPTCGGLGGWPIYTQETVNSRLSQLTDNMALNLVRA